MKYFFMFFLMTSSLAVHAGTMTINAREVSCKELKATVENYREVIVISKGLVGKIYTRVWDQRPACLPFHTPNRAFFRTEDKRNCQAGWMCEYRPRE